MIKTKFGVTVLHKVDYPHSSVSKESDFKAGDPGSMLGWEDSLEEEMATRSSILVWRTDRGAWKATVHGVARVENDLVTKPP